ncbi:MAG: C1 family peptidase, partial [Bacteriovoracaceae bacterium]
REALKRKREQEKKSESSVKTNDDSMSLVERRNQGLNRLKRNVQKTYSNWENKIKETYKRWDQKRKIYKKNIPTYKSNTFEIELQSSGASFQSSPKPLNPLQSAKKSAFHIIPGALDVPVKDQGKRPTCAAFAGVRAIETILKGHNRDVDLSEQYFYWSSKPKCQNRPCQKKGSWVYNGFKRSMRKPRPDIPSDGSCPYQAFPKQDNETQIPLRPSCQQGVTQVKGFKELKSLGEILTSLEQNSPVVGGFKLSPNFYQTKGLVSYQESFRSGSTDSHAQGHALLLVGFMELPKERWNTEGKYCLLTANSWGEGWGKGGFGCLSEKWVRNHMIPNAFISLTKVGL